ncbi:hypothetical protein NL676_019885 [Syzygium grande]|nr:hypothetical protein NL676_019885 [Syzygium grande]
MVFIDLLKLSSLSPSSARSSSHKATFGRSFGTYLPRSFAQVVQPRPWTSLSYSIRLRTFVSMSPSSSTSLYERWCPSFGYLRA